MNITEETDSYNERRYGKPWIANVDFGSNKKGVFIWGDWVGDGRNGGEGVLSIECNPSDIIAKGQKDFRKSRNSAPNFYRVTNEGEFDYIGDKGKAYKYYLSQKENDIDIDALKAEKGKLLTRIDEIDKLLAPIKRRKLQIVD